MRIVIALAASALAACSSREVAPVPPAPATAALAHVRSTRDFAWFGRPDLPLDRELTVSLPNRAGEPTRLETEDAWIEIRPRGLDDIGASRVDAATVFVDAAKATDVLWERHDHHVEEVRVLRDARASTTFRYSLRASRGLDVRVRGGRVEVFDEKGYVHFSTSPMFAVDANGVHRELDVRVSHALDGFALVATLSAADLAFPVIVDPAWTTLADCPTFHTRGQSAALPDGRLIVYGGQESHAYNVYDPATNTWSNGFMPPGPRKEFASVQLADGRALAIGGADGTGTAMSDVVAFVAASSSWTTLASTKTTGHHATAIRLVDGRIFKVGGDVPAAAEIYNPSTNTWTSVATSPRDFSDARAALLGDGRVLVHGSVGTYNFGAVYNPATNTWITTGGTSGKYNDDAYRLVSLTNGRALLVGAPYGAGISSPFAEVYDGATNAWTKTTSMTVFRDFAGAIGLPNNRALFIGGESGGTYQTNVEVYDATTDTFTGAPSLPQGRSKFPPPQRIGDSVYIATGIGPSSNKLTLHRYKLDANGTACPSGGAPCASGYCVDGVCCASASCPGGTCNAITPGVCRLNDGGACTADGDCASGHCADGVCCNVACKDKCGACNLPGKVGKCSAVVGAPKAGHGTCPTGGTGVCDTPQCDGKDATKCGVAPTSTPCSADGCSGTVETHASFCDGSGKCADVPKDCDTYACGATTCKASCTTNADCSAKGHCDTSIGKCVPLEGLGSKCTVASDCSGGLPCVDGVCCNPPSGKSACDTGYTCAAPGREGTCTLANGTICTASIDCGSGYCVDGVCCETACTGQCEACDVMGNRGKCVPVSGKPHGGREGCAAATGDACTAASCDGTTTTSCAGFVGADATCRDESCQAGMYTAPAVCDGKGKCADVVNVTCDGFICDAEGKKCRKTCASDTECVEGFRCESGACRRITAKCSEDGTESVPLMGAPVPCTPYVCKTDGTCGNACGSSSECAPGFVCDNANKQCVAQPGEEDSGGCAFGRRPIDSVAAALGLLAFLGLRRRR